MQVVIINRATKLTIPSVILKISKAKCATWNETLLSSTVVQSL